MIRVILPARLVTLAEEMARGEGANLDTLYQAAVKETLVLPVVSVFFAAQQLRHSHEGDALALRLSRLRALVDLTEDTDVAIVLSPCDDLPADVEGWFGAEGIELPWEHMANGLIERLRRLHPGRPVTGW